MVDQEPRSPGKKFYLFRPFGLVCQSRSQWRDLVSTPFASFCCQFALREEGDSAAEESGVSPAMAAALECWSGRPSTDEEMVEQVLMKPHVRSDDSLPTCADAAFAAGEPTTAQAAPKKWQRLGRNFAGAIAAFKSSLNLDNGSLPRDPSPRAVGERPPLLVRGFQQLYSRGGATQQLPEKLVADLRRHFDALPNRSVSQSSHPFFFFLCSETIFFKKGLNNQQFFWIYGWMSNCCLFSGKMPLKSLKQPFLFFAY